jgi:uncharacterized protein YjbI with pentapeptide repeats
LTSMSSSTLIQELEEAERLGKLAYEQRAKIVRDDLDLSHRTVDVAALFTKCTFEGKVDLRYCEFKQAVKFCNFTFKGEFDSGDDTDSRTVYRKNLVCNDSTFWGAAKFRGVRCEGRALFRKAKFFRGPPLKDNVHPAALEKPPADFTAATFRSLDCDGAVFEGAVSFRGVECAARASFQEAQFNQHCC